MVQKLYNKNLLTMEEKNTEKKIAGEKKTDEKNVVLEAELLPDDFSDEDTEQDDDFDSSEDILGQTDFIDEKDYLDVMNYANNSIALEENHEDNAVMVAPRHLPAVQDNLQLYLREVSKFPLLEPDEEVALARRVRDSGDSEAAFRIISSHLRLVVRVAMDFQRRWMQNVLDLIQEGNVGLMRAVNKFDPDKGIKFSYYATFWIKAYILKFIMDNWRMVKIGTTQAQRKLFYNLNKERQKLISQGFDPDEKTLSEALGVSVEQVVEMQQRLDTSDLSLDMPTNSDDNSGSTKLDFLPALTAGVENSLASEELSDLVRYSLKDLLPDLSDKELFILEHRLLTDDPVTLREIGEKYHVSRERIRQLEARLLQKLKTHLGTKIKDFSEEWIQS